MEIILTIILSSVVGIAAFFIADRYMYAKRIIEMQENAEELLEEFNEKVIYSRVEVEDNTIIMYNNETDEFLAQGKNWEELNKKLKERFPDKWFHLDQDVIDRIKSFNRESA